MKNFASSSPGPVSPGANRSEGVDWFRAVGSRSQLEWLTERMASHGKMEVGRGQWGWFTGGHKFESGAKIFFNDGDVNGCCVELSGTVCASMEADDLLQFMADVLVRGFHCTRVDVCLDYRGRSESLVDQVIASCTAGELCGAKCWKPHPIWNQQTLIGNGVSIGKRGSDGSGRFVRVYDKGLETRERERGQWERLEVEHSGDVANQAAIALCQSLLAGEDWRDVAASLAVSAIDFREVTGQDALDRRPRLDWWSRVVDGAEFLRCVARRRMVSLQGQVTWLRKQVLPGIKQLAVRLGCSVHQAIEHVAGAGQMIPRDDGRLRSWVWQALAVEVRA